MVLTGSSSWRAVVRPAALILALASSAAVHGAPGAETPQRSPAVPAAGHARAPIPIDGAPPQDQAAARAARLVEVSPRLGPPGTPVTLKAARMPALTPVQLAIGATRTGFEALALGMTSIDGELEAVVEVPDWTKRDEPHRFIVFNLYFTNVLAESPIFHVTDADGRVVREGTVTSAGAACLVLVADDGERFRLVGATGDLEVGVRARLEGVLSAPEDGCGDDLSLEIELRSGGAVPGGNAR